MYPALDSLQTKVGDETSLVITVVKLEAVLVCNKIILNNKRLKYIKDNSMAETMWMVRAGEGAYLIEEFARGYVVLGWPEVGDLTKAKTQEDIRAMYNQANPDSHPSKAANAAAMLYKFRFLFDTGTKVVTYDPDAREYLIGNIASDYYYNPGDIEDYPHFRKVDWRGRVSRDQLSVAARNTLGSTLTLFSINEEVTAELLAGLSGQETVRRVEEAGDEKEELGQIKEDTVSRAHELIKDKILELSADEMEQLVAAILRAMGYRTRVMPKGPDRGLDVLASPDGLGLQEPRIKAEVKHRTQQMGSHEIRSFIGGLREGDKALYISTGGFSKEARYEADRSNIPLTLLGLDDLATLIVTHYENFDVEGKLLIPLVRIYWPAE